MSARSYAAAEFTKTDLTEGASLQQRLGAADHMRNHFEAIRVVIRVDVGSRALSS
jgi:hypothetical protein